MSRERVDQMRQLFSQEPCWMMEGLSAELGCAVISVRRSLKQTGYFRSYSHNGKWYTLRSFPHFNRHGIWLYGDIGFSRHGNLTQTMMRLINKSAAGLSARRLAETLQLSCHAVLTRLYKGGRIDRARPAHEFVYLSRDKIMNRMQRERLSAGLVEAAQPLSAEAAVLILADFIKHPRLSFAQLAQRLGRSRNITVLPEAIARFFQDHRIKKTKSPGRGS